MLENALQGNKSYWAWIGFLIALIAIGGLAYINQFNQGLVVTDLSRDVSWGFYIAQLTYLVGVAASGVMLVIPYYLHNYKDFKDMVIFGEFLAVAAIVMCILFVVVDLGMPSRLFNVIIHPSPGSVLFWDMTVLNGYMLLNLIVGWVTLQSERNNLKYPSWVWPLIYLSVPFAFSIHTVTAFLYAGIPGRHYWLTAILAARFLASAFCSGPAVMLLLMLVVEKVSGYKFSDKGIKTLTKIIAYAMCLNVFFFFLELFTAFYSGIPGHQQSIVYLFAGLDGYGSMVPWFWTAATMAFISLALLIPPKLRDNRTLLPISLSILVGATWIDKGLGLVVAGFIPNMFKGVTEYWPSSTEMLISMAVFAIGALILTVLWKVAVDVKKQARA